MAVVSDKDKLTQIGVSVFGTLEAEGIKVCKDKLYLGYTARGVTAEKTKHYQNIFVFDPSSDKRHPTGNPFPKERALAHCRWRTAAAAEGFARSRLVTRR